MAEKTIQKKAYDLEERTFAFARDVRAFVRMLPRSIVDLVDARQLVRSSGSIGANYIEANESLGRKDFIMHAKICRKEAKETVYWLRMFDVLDEKSDAERHKLVQEAAELMKIFGAIVTRSSQTS